MPRSSTARSLQLAAAASLAALALSACHKNNVTAASDVSVMASDNSAVSTGASDTTGMASPNASGTAADSMGSPGASGMAAGSDAQGAAASGTSPSS